MDAKNYALTVVIFTAIVPTMYKRCLSPPSSSILLLGPRGTGKSTWIQQHFGDAETYDLLDSREALRLERRPDLLFKELQHLPPESWVVIDEVQKVPAVMDEVHRLMECRKLRFILCGSSARKLKRTGSNLLAGRAIVSHMFPLTFAELNDDFNPDSALTHGTLPMAITGNDPEGYLSTYADVYLNEEIRAEALTRNVGAFSRFLEVAARQNAQVTNIANIARDAAVGRSTVQNYFDILVDTLIGYWVPAWKLKTATKQVKHPKFFLFDTGVARTLSGRLPYPPTQEELGPLLETLVFAEVKAFLAYRQLRYKPYFWSNYDGTEVDLLCETQTGFVAIEIKAAEEWQKRFNRGLHLIQQELSPRAVTSYGVYRGNRQAHFDSVNILPLSTFLDLLWRDKIIS
jgi:predicted AAA+ superfamily ATPase